MHAIHNVLKSPSFYSKKNSIEIFHSATYFVLFMGSIAESLMKCV
jgi:hypothetical protein